MLATWDASPVQDLNVYRCLVWAVGRMSATTLPSWMLSLCGSGEGSGWQWPVKVVLGLATLRGALAELGPTLPELVDETMVVDPLYAAARGMAVYARRRQEVPGDCMEGWWCDSVRERERAEARERKLEL
jgi:hypothetical protein